MHYAAVYIFIMNTKLNTIIFHRLTISSKEVKQLLHQLYTNIPLGNKKFPYKITSLKLQIKYAICNIREEPQTKKQQKQQSYCLNRLSTSDGS